MIAAGGVDEAMVVDTLGGRMHVRWAESAAATPNGQLVFFAEFLATARVFDRWVIAEIRKNHRFELLWRLMRSCPYVVAGLRRAGFIGGWL